MAQRRRWPGAGRRADRRAAAREAGAAETIVLVRRAGTPDTAEPSARGLLTHPEGVLVCDPPTELLDGELVAVVAVRSASGRLTEPERIAVRQGVALRSPDDAVTGVILGLAVPAAAPATALVGADAAFLGALRGGGAATGGEALVEAGLLDPDQIVALSDETRSALEATRLPDWSAGLEPDRTRWRFLCFIFRCR